MRKSLLCLICLFVFSSTFVHAKTYYVAKNGDNSNPGTEAQPWLTISRAASMAIAGDTIFIKRGTYNEKVRFSNNGTEDAYITYKVYNNHTVTIDYSGTDDHVILFTKAYIIFDGFKIISHKYQPIRLNPGAHHVTIRNCELTPSVTGATSHGLLIESDAVHHCIFERNLIHGHGMGKLHHGMYIKGDYHIIDGNIVYDNAEYGIHLYNKKGSVRHNIVRNNICYGNGVKSKKSGSGIIVTQGDNLIYNNICYKNRGMDSNSNSFGVFVYKVPVGSGPNNIYNNVLYDNGLAGIGIQGSDNTIVKNNICMKNGKFNIFVLQSTNTTVDYNCYYPDNSSAFLWGRGNIYDFSGYKKVSGQDVHSICKDPKFVAAESFNFTLQPDSPCRNAGTEAGLPFKGNKPDIGVKENR
jgi:parallel beta-helix repeat protein